ELVLADDAKPHGRAMRPGDARVVQRVGEPRSKAFERPRACESWRHDRRVHFPPRVEPQLPEVIDFVGVRASYVHRLEARTRTARVQKIVEIDAAAQSRTRVGRMPR